MNWAKATEEREAQLIQKGADRERRRIRRAISGALRLLLDVGSAHGLAPHPCEDIYRTIDAATRAQRSRK